MEPQSRGYPTRQSVPQRRTTLLLAVLVWLSCAWFGSWEWNPNNSTRLFAAISLVEQGDATIDEFAELTIDKARFDEHIYLDKAPGMTLAALPAVAAANLLTGETSGWMPKWLGQADLERFLRLRLRAAAATGPALLTALAAAMIFQLGLGWTGDARAALGGALAFALGSPIWGWSTTIFGHAAVAALFVLALGLALRGGRGAAVLAGLALGWAVTVEYQAVLAGSVLAGFAAWRWWRMGERQWIALAAIGGVIGLLPLIGYSWLAFGTPFRVGYSGVVGFDGMNQGLFGLTAPDAGVLWEILFGVRRGLLWVAPVLVVAPLGFATLWQRDRAITLAVAAAIGVVLLVNAASVYWDGGHSTGPRHAMPAVGLLALGVAPFWAALERRGRQAMTAWLGLSMTINLVIAAAEITAPDTYRFPLWSRVVVERFWPGALRDLPSQFWGWSPWGGLALYLVLALPMLGLLIRWTGRGRPAPRVTGARG